MNVLAWLLSALLAVLFLVIAASKLTQSRSKLLGQPGFGYAAGFTAVQLKAIGVLELLGALGLVLPTIDPVPAVLAPLAAIGLALVMVGATVVHLRRGERDRVPATIVLLVMLVLVSLLRLGPVPL